MELMHVELTVYSLTGIRKEVDIDNDVQNRRRQRKEQRIAQSETSNSPPTTAIVSVWKNTGYSMQTFLPSLELELYSSASKSKGFNRYRAHWQSDDTGDSSSSEGQDYLGEPSSSTIFMQRQMTRESYRRNRKIGRVPHFEPERIDLVIGMGTGKSYLPIGEASIALTGEEEAQVISVVPVRAFAKRECPRGKRAETRSLHLFSLDTNATLRVGIRAISSELIEQEVIYNQRMMNCSNDLHLRHVNASTIELDDENLLLQDMASKSMTQNNLEWLFDGGIQRVQAVIRTTLLPCCNGLGVDMSEYQNEHQNCSNRAKVLLPQLMSDMSETAFDSGSEADSLRAILDAAAE